MFCTAVRVSIYLRGNLFTVLVRTFLRPLQISKSVVTTEVIVFGAERIESVKSFIIPEIIIPTWTMSGWRVISSVARICRYFCSLFCGPDVHNAPQLFFNNVSYAQNTYRFVELIQQQLKWAASRRI